MFSKFVFCVGTKVFEEALNAVKFLGLLKKFGPAIISVTLYLIGQFLIFALMIFYVVSVIFIKTG